MPRSICRYGSLLLALMMVVVTPAFAQGQSEATPTAVPVFSVSPTDAEDLAPFRFEIAAGASAESTLVVLNDGEDVVELHSFAVDITTAVNGGYMVIPEGSTGDVSAWISMHSRPYAVEPGGEIAIGVSVSVPSGTAPGEYMAAIATETTSSFAMEGTDAFRQVSRKVNAVVITVPGPVAAGFEIGTPVIETIDGVSRVSVPIENTGNARVRPAGAIDIRTAEGEMVATIPVAMGSVYAWHSTTIEANLSPGVPTGTYLVTVELVDAASGISTSFTGPVTAIQSST